MKRVFLNDDSSIKCVLEGTKELIELNTSLTANFVDDVEPSSSTDYFDNESGTFISIGNPPSSNHVFNYTSKEWFDPRSLAEIKEQRWKEIKKQRDTLEFSGFEFEGNVYDSDTTSQGRIVAAASLGVAVEWTLKDNSTIWLEPEQLKQLQIALAVHVTSVHARGKIAREAIYAASTVEEVEAVQF